MSAVQGSPRMLPARRSYGRAASPSSAEAIPSGKCCGRTAAANAGADALSRRTALKADESRAHRIRIGKGHHWPPGRNPVRQHDPDSRSPHAEHHPNRPTPTAGGVTHTSSLTQLPAFTPAPPLTSVHEVTAVVDAGVLVRNQRRPRARDPHDGAAHRLRERPVDHQSQSGRTSGSAARLRRCTRRHPIAPSTAGPLSPCGYQASRCAHRLDTPGPRLAHQ
jgi:hypothetical protein